MGIVHAFVRIGIVAVCVGVHSGALVLLHERENVGKGGRVADAVARELHGSLGLSGKVDPMGMESTELVGSSSSRDMVSLEEKGVVEVEVHDKAWEVVVSVLVKAESVYLASGPVLPGAKGDVDVGAEHLQTQLRDISTRTRRSVLLAVVHVVQWVGKISARADAIEQGIGLRANREARRSEHWSPHTSRLAKGRAKEAVAGTRGVGRRRPDRSLAANWSANGARRGGGRARGTGWRAGEGARTPPLVRRQVRQ